MKIQIQISLVSLLGSAAFKIPRASVLPRSSLLPRNLEFASSTSSTSERITDEWAPPEAQPTLDSIGASGGNSEKVCGEIQLEELEADTTTITGLKLLPGGGVELLATDGPIPKGMQGEWRSDGQSFWMILTRIFDVENFIDTSYTVSRVFVGDVETHPGYVEIGGEVRTYSRTSRGEANVPSKLYRINIRSWSATPPQATSKLWYCR